MNIIEELEKSWTAQNEENEDIAYLKKSDLPLVLFGTAALGRLSKYLFDKNSIKIDFVAVDKEYLQQNTKFYEFEVHSLEDILANNSKVNIVLAFVGKNNEERIIQLNEMENVQKCLFIDCTFSTPISGFSFILENSLLLTNLYNCLTDDLSRKVMLEFLKLKKFMSPKELVKLNIPDEHQYFPDFLPLYNNEVFVDCGAYDGDTIKVFLNKTNGRYNKIFAFEPDSRNAEKCRTSLENSGGGGYLV